MPPYDEHPTVRAVLARPQPAPPTAIPAERLRRICLDAGADDVGFVSIDREEIASERPHALAAMSGARTLVSIVTRLQREDIRTPMRSVGNLEFHRSYHHINDVAHTIAAALEREGIRALNPSAGFPMEMDRYPGRIWVVAHKPIAVAAGLGQIGIHRNVIHPVFGSFVNLATILVACDIDEESAPVAFNPCLECKLCVAACPVGAIEPDGYFNFAACATHNYREFMGGFMDWTETIADAKDGMALQKNSPPSEQASMWQSLSFGANYKAAYCVAVCPAGEDVIGPYLADKGGFKRDVLKPLTEKLEPVYVVADTDAEAHVAKRFPHKTARRVRATLRPQHIPGFLMGIKLSFQRARSVGLSATYHFVFTGKEPKEATVRIHERTLTVTPGLAGSPDLVVRADSAAWLQFVRKERGIAGLLATRKLRLKGSPKLLLAFGRCFP